MGVQGLARFAYTLIIGNIASKESLGEISALLSLSVFASLFWPAAAGVAASRFIPDLKLSETAIAVLKRSFIIAVLILAVLTAPVTYFLGSDLSEVFGTVALVISYSGYVFVRGVLLGEDRIIRATVIDTITSFIAITILVLVLFAGWHWATLLPLTISYLVFTLVSWPKGGRVRTSAMRREVLLFTRDSTLAMIATGGLLPVTMLFVRAFDTPTVAGLFAAGLSLATPANLLAQSVNQVLVPHFARMLGGPISSMRRSQLHVFLVSLVGFVAVFGLLIWLSPWILDTFFQGEYNDGLASMQVMLVVVGMMSLMAAPSAYLVATGRQGLYARIWLVATILGILVMLLAAPTMGQWGAVAGFVLGGIGGSLAVVVCGLTLAPRTLQPDPAPE
ncbi:lipopolysaccharide biosynthesis protein [Leucobacter coleopterorum]|nr:hypothetical protein [Leucobacter coleopterorum]